MKKHSGLIWNSLGSTMFAANTFILQIVVTRVMGISLAGEFAIAFTTAQLIYIIGIFGVTSFQVTDYKREYSFSDYFYFKIATTVLMLMSGVMISLFYFSSVETMILINLLTIYMAVHAFSDLYQSLYLQHNRVDLMGKSLFFRTLISLITFVISLYALEDLFASIIFMAGVALISGYFFTYRPKRYIDYTVSAFEKMKLKSLFNHVFPLFLCFILVNIIISVPKYTLDFFYGSDTVGYFNILYFPIQGMSLVGTFIFLPTINKYLSFIKSNDKHAFMKLLRNQITLISAITIVLAILVWFIGVQILGEMYNVDITEFKVELVLAVIIGAPLAISTLVQYLITAFRAIKVLVLLYMVCTIVCIVTSIILASLLGILGVLISLFISYIILLVFGIILIVRRVNKIQS